MESLKYRGPNSDTGDRRLRKLNFVKENFDMWQSLSIGIYTLKSSSVLLINRNGCKTKSMLIFPTNKVPLFLINIFFRVGGRRISHLAIYLSIDGS